MPDPKDTGAEEGFLTKADKFLRKWTGGDEYNRRNDALKKSFREAAPRTADALEKTAKVLETGAMYTEIPGGLMIGMARKAKVLKGAEEAKAARTPSGAPKPSKAAAGGTAAKAVEQVKATDNVKRAKAVSRPVKEIKPRPARDIVAGDPRLEWLSGGKKARPAADVKAGDARDTFLRKLKTAPKTQGRGTFTDRLPDAKTSRGPFPVPAVRKDNLPAVQKKGLPAVRTSESRELVPYKAPGTKVVKYEPRPTSVAKIESKAGESAKRSLGKPERVVAAADKTPKSYKALKTAAAAGVVGGAYLASKKFAAKKADATTSGGVPPKKTVNSYRSSGTPSKTVNPYKASQSSSQESAAKKDISKNFKLGTGAQTGKRKAKPARSSGEGKLTNFERMKMRQYEKEGTVFDPRARVIKERKYHLADSLADLFKKKKR